MNLRKLMHKIGVDRMQVPLINGEPHPALIALADELELHWKKTVIERDEYAEELRAEVEKLTKEREKLKTVPMKYRRMQFNAELQEDVRQLEQQLATLAAQNEKLKDALRTVVDDSEECTDFDGWTAMLLSLDAYHIASTCLEETNDQTDLATPVLNRIRAEGMRMAAESLIDPMDRAAAQKICAQADELEKQNG